MPAKKEDKIPSREPRLVFARECIKDKHYVGVQKHCVIWFTGRLGKEWGHERYEFKGLTNQGDYIQEHLVLPDAPIREDDELAKEIVAEHERRVKNQPKTYKTKEVVDPETGEVRQVVVKSKPRGEVDPRTGYGAGTDAHTFGLILLELGTENRAACVEAIFEQHLKARGKPKNYAAAWYTYLRAKKPEIYRKG